MHFDYDVSMRFCAPVLFIVSLFVSGCSETSLAIIPEVGERVVERYENGQKRLEGHILGDWVERETSEPNTQSYGYWYENGMKQGLWTMWHENGQKMAEAGLEIGMAEGIFRMWYDNGQIREEGIYKNSEKNGICRGWHEDGTINAELSGIYKDGKKISDQE